MHISENLSFDDDLLQSKDHSKNIEIISLNLDDYNRRYNTNVKLTYYKKHSSITADNQYDNSCYNIINRLYSYLSYYRNKTSENEGDFINRILWLIKDFNLVPILRELDKNANISETLQKDIQDFKDHFVGFYPKGILSSSGEKEFKQVTIYYGQQIDEKLN